MFRRHRTFVRTRVRARRCGDAGIWDVYLAGSFGILDCELAAFLPLKLSGAGSDGDCGVAERETGDR